MKVLFTSGPTREFIDSVRFISNISSGQTGAKLADMFIGLGHQVTFLYGGDSKTPGRECQKLNFESYRDLDLLLKKILLEEDFDVIIHLSAVSDYSLKNEIEGKLESKEDELTLTLKRNPKIINQLSSYAKRSCPVIVGFKLTDSEREQDWAHAVEKIFNAEGVCLVVHNDLRDMKDGHRYRIFDHPLNFKVCESADILSKELIRKLEGLL